MLRVPELANKPHGKSPELFFVDISRRLLRESLESRLRKPKTIRKKPEEDLESLYAALPRRSRQIIKKT